MAPPPPGLSHSLTIVIAVAVSLLAALQSAKLSLPTVSSWSLSRSPITAVTTTRRSILFLHGHQPPRQYYLRLWTTMSGTNAADVTESRTTASTGNKHSTLHHILSYVPYLSQTGDDVTGSDVGRVQLILASQSPRRREILDMMGLQRRFQVIPSPLKEEEVQVHYSASLPPTEYTRRLAEEKALALAQTFLTKTTTTAATAVNSLHPTLVLGSDTIVELHGNVLEKPRHVNDARNMLRQLSGQEHQVHTGVALYLVESSSTNTTELSSSTPISIRLLSSFTDTAWVQFASLSSQDIEAYVATGEPLDKAGSYGIQGVGGQFVTKITGDFFTVMGLPAHRTSQALAKAMAELVDVNDEV